jgi:hypothetical protein
VRQCRGSVGALYILFMSENGEILRIALFSFFFIGVLALLGQFATASTTQQLITADTENLEDTYIGSYSSQHAVNYGTSNSFTFQRSSTSGNQWIFIKYNVSAIPTGKNILNATFCGFVVNVYPSNAGSMNWCGYHVLNYTWVETYPTWDNWKDQSNSTTNQTAESCFYVKEPSLNTYQCLDFTQAFKRDYDELNTNFTIRVLGIPQSYADNNETDITSKEGTNKPYLNVSYEDMPETTTTIEESSTTTIEQTTTTEETTTTEATTSTVYENGCGFPLNVSGSCCVSSDLLYIQQYFGVNGTYYNKNETFFCSNGCDYDNGICNPSNFTVYLIIMVVIIVVLYVLKRFRVW